MHSSSSEEGDWFARAYLTSSPLRPVSQELPPDPLPLGCIDDYVRTVLRNLVLRQERAEFFYTRHLKTMTIVKNDPANREERARAIFELDQAFSALNNAEKCRELIREHIRNLHGIELSPHLYLL